MRRKMSEANKKGKPVNIKFVTTVGTVKPKAVKKAAVKKDKKAAQKKKGEKKAK
jgi:hypothetical protein